MKRPQHDHMGRPHHTHMTNVTTEVLTFTAAFVQSKPGSNRPYQIRRLLPSTQRKSDSRPALLTPGPSILHRSRAAHNGLERITCNPQCLPPHFLLSSAQQRVQHGPADSCICCTLFKLWTSALLQACLQRDTLLAEQPCSMYC